MSDLMSFEFDLEGQVVKGDMNKALAIDTSSPEVIAKQLEQTPKILYYFGSAAEKALVMDNALKLEYKVWWAKVSNPCKKAVSEEFGKSSLSEKAILNEVILQHEEAYVEWQEKLEKSRHQKDTLLLAQDSWVKKHESLINLLSLHKSLAKMERG